MAHFIYHFFSERSYGDSSDAWSPKRAVWRPIAGRQVAISRRVTGELRPERPQINCASILFHVPAIPGRAAAAGRLDWIGSRDRHTPIKRR